MSQSYDLHAKPCARCGQEIDGETMWTRINRGSANRNCQDCNAGKRYEVKNGDLICKPWQGDVDLDTFQPLDKKGQPYMPGERICGNADCVEKTHVVTLLGKPTTQDLIAEQFSVFYRTGERRNYQELIDTLRREAQHA